MRLGLSSFTYTWAVGVPGHEPAEPLGAVGLVERARELGVTVVQLADNLPVHRLTDAELDELDEARSGAGIGLELGTRGIGPHLVRYAELAERLGSPIVRIVVDSATDHPSLDQAIDRLRAYRGVFEDRGLRLAIENHDRFRAHEMAALVESLGPWTGICLDTVNSFGCLEPPSIVVPLLAPLAINLHLKDFTIRRHSHAMGFEIEGTPAGDGLLEIPDLLRRVAAGGGAESAILELWTPPADDLAATIAREAEWARRSIDHLRANTDLVFA